MHWHAIRQSNGYSNNQGLQSRSKLQQLDENDNTAKAGPSTPQTSPPVNEGDDACDLRSNTDELALRKIESWDSWPPSSAESDDDVFGPLAPRKMGSWESWPPSPAGADHDGYGPLAPRKMGSWESWPPSPAGADHDVFGPLAPRKMGSWESWPPSPAEADDNVFGPLVQAENPGTSPGSEIVILEDDRGIISESRLGGGTISFEIVDDSNLPVPPSRRRRTECKVPESVGSSDDGNLKYTEAPFLQVDIPRTPANNLTPYAYRRALLNRIAEDDLWLGHRYDIKAYTPTFVYDCLVLPGSLANICGKGSAEDMIHTMTPAFLPGFAAYHWNGTHEPCILPSSRPGEHVHGMLVFGQSKQTRRNIHEFYREHYKRIKVEVQFEEKQRALLFLHLPPDQRYYLRRRKIWAHTWIWRDAAHGDIELRVSQEEKLGWRYDDYLAFEMEKGQKEGLTIAPAGWIEDDRESVGSDESLGDVEMEHGKVKDEGWEGTGQDETGSWEEGSDGGAAVEWDEQAWAALPDVQIDEAIGKAAGETNGDLTDNAAGETTDDATSEADEQGGYGYYVQTGTLDRDYDRSGSAGMW